VVEVGALLAAKFWTPTFARLYDIDSMLMLMQHATNHISYIVYRIHKSPSYSNIASFVSKAIRAGIR